MTIVTYILEKISLTMIMMLFIAASWGKFSKFMIAVTTIYILTATINTYQMIHRGGFEE